MKRVLIITEQAFLLYRQEKNTLLCELQLAADDESSLQDFLVRHDSAYCVLMWPGSTHHVHLPHGMSKKDRMLLLQQRMQEHNNASHFLSEQKLPNPEGILISVLSEEPALLKCLELLFTTGRRIAGIYSLCGLAGALAQANDIHADESIFSLHTGRTLLQVFLKMGQPYQSRQVTCLEPKSILVEMRQFRAHLIRQQFCRADRPLTWFSLDSSHCGRIDDPIFNDEFKQITHADANTDDSIQSLFLKIIFSAKPKSYALGKYGRENQFHHLALACRLTGVLCLLSALLFSLNASWKTYSQMRQTEVEEEALELSAQALKTLQERLPEARFQEIEEDEDWQKRPPAIGPILARISHEISHLSELKLTSLHWQWSDAKPQILTLQLGLHSENVTHAKLLAKQLAGDLQELPSGLYLRFEARSSP